MKREHETLMKRHEVAELEAVFDVRFRAAESFGDDLDMGGAERTVIGDRLGVTIVIRDRDTLSVDGSAVEARRVWVDGAGEGQVGDAPMMNRHSLQSFLPGDLEVFDWSVREAQQGCKFVLRVVRLPRLRGFVSETEESQSGIAEVGKVDEHIHGAIEDTVSLVFTDEVLVDLLRLAQRDKVPLVLLRVAEQPERGEPSRDLVVTDVVGEDVRKPSVGID